MRKLVEKILEGTATSVDEEIVRKGGGSRYGGPEMIDSSIPVDL